MKIFKHRVKPQVLAEFQSDDTDFIAQVILHNELVATFEVVLMDFYFNPEGDTWRNRFRKYLDAYEFAADSTLEYEEGSKSYLKKTYHPNLAEQSQ